MPDLLGALLLAVALGLLTTGLVQGPEWGWSDRACSGALAVSALATAGFVLSSRRHRSPLLDPALLRIRSFAVGNALTVVAGAGFYAYLLTHVLYLSYVWDYSLLRAGWPWRRPPSSPPWWPRCWARWPTGAATGSSCCPVRRCGR
jgi:NTE family protein